MSADTIQAFLFDLGRVLIEFDHSKGFVQVGALTGMDPQEVARLYEAENWQARYECGEITTGELVEHLKKHATHSQFSEAEFIVAAGDIFSPKADTIALVAELHQAKHKLCIVSNTCDAHMRYCLPRYDFFQMFPRKVFSHEVGTAKPDRRFYELACAAVDEPPESCLFIDDRPENIAGAKDFGMHTHLFQNSDKLRQQISHYRLV